MLKLHCLAYSRAIRVEWLLQELDTPHELVLYDRTEKFGAPDSLKAVHPLGKSPVIEDDGLVLAESSTILRYVDATYGDNRFQPEPGTQAYFEHSEWLDYAESSAAMPILSAVFDTMADKEEVPEEPRMKAELANNLDHIEDRLSDRPYLMGDAPMLADIQMSYMLSLLELTGQLENRPILAAYWQRIKDQPGLRAAVSKTGPMTPPAI
ncbi:glutathione S-transferase family protein [Sulfitobacter aestuarii]|uniref:Glutathione S-transferase family protein n=1 Tax=Sulfitobacter aestuarii TaxID=2161676 RepID=A0ABW5U6D0_9RHOB